MTQKELLHQVAAILLNSQTPPERQTQIDRENQERLKLRPTGQASRDRLVRAQLQLRSDR